MTQRWADRPAPAVALAALAYLTSLRLILAAWMPLSADEAYYWVWSRAPAAGYLDHPPMVAFWIRAGTALAGQTALGVRLLAPAAAAAGSIILARAGDLLVPGSGIPAAALMNATLLFGVGAVTMTPDTPLLFFWTVALWALAKGSRAGEADRGRRAWLLMAGLSAGLALASKYPAFLLTGGAAVWLLVTPLGRKALRTPFPWLGLALAGLVFTPVLAWNAGHGWASFFKQGSRIGDFDPSRALRFLGELVGGQLVLATPLVFVLCAAGCATAVRKAMTARDPGWTLIACLTALPSAVFIQHALGDRVQANWPAIIYPAAAVAAASLGGFWSRLQGPAVISGLVLTGLVSLHATFNPLTLPPTLDPITLRLVGWQGFADDVAAAAREQGAAFVAADNYGVAAELAWRLPAGIQVVGVESRWGLFNLPPADLAGRAGLFVRSERRGDDVDHAPWAEMTDSGEAFRARHGVTAEAFRLYRVIGRASATPTIELPRPNPDFRRE